MNTRRAVFQDVRVREALGLLFDFEWIDRTLYADGFERSQSLFEGSELSARGRPADAAERQLLASVGASVRSDILDGSYAVPVSDGTGADRARLRQALAMLGQAGTASTAEY